MGLTKVLSGEIEPHPCHSPHGERFPFLPVFGRNPVFRLSTMLTKASCFCDILHKNGCKTIAAVLYTVETQACIHFMKGIQHGWGG